MSQHALWGSKYLVCICTVQYNEVIYGIYNTTDWSLHKAKQYTVRYVLINCTVYCTYLLF
jgi:hypothetical protein